MAIKVINPGALTTVQDAGRYGLQQLGITVCGVMDLQSFETANRIIGNGTDCAVLEMTLFGGSYEFLDDTYFALAGADMKPLLNGEDAAMYAAVRAKKGDVLTLGMAQKGCRAYLAVIGGFDVPAVMGSRSTDIKSRLGGFSGRKLQAGDVLACSCCEEDRMFLYAPEKPEFSSSPEIRVIGGPQEDMFTEKGIADFYGGTYKLTESCDRMGYRLSGNKIEAKGKTDIISDGIVFGSVQVPSSGQPIVLMADRQTAGGYAKIATVCSFDLPKLAQLKPGDSVKFKKISVQDAHRLLSGNK